MDPQGPKDQPKPSFTGPEPQAGREDPRLAEHETANQKPVVLASGVQAEDVSEPSPTISWEASEFVQHQKPAWWYLALVGAALLLVAVFVLLRQYLTIGLIAVMAVAVWVYSRKEPRTLKYAVDAHGVTVGEKILPYSHFKSYSSHEEVGWQELELEPAKRFAQRLTLLVSQDNFDAIDRALSHHLPRIERRRDAADRFSRYIKF